MGNLLQPEDEPPIRLYTPAEAAHYLAVKESWLRRKVTERAVSHTFLGKHLRFSAHDLQTIVTHHHTSGSPPTSHPRS